MTKGLNSRAGSRSIELTKDVEAGNESDETEAHDEDDGGGNLQARSIVGVEPQHVATATRSGANNSTRAGGTSGCETTSTEAGGRRRGATRSSDARSGCRRGCRLRLRGASGHGLGRGGEDRN